MADTKISALQGASTPLAGTEVLPIVQSGATDQVSVANLTAGRNVTMAKLSAGTTGTSGGAVTALNPNSDTVSNIGRFYQYNAAGTDWAGFDIQADAAGNLVNLISTGSSAGGFVFKSASTARMTLAAAGDATLHTGNLVIGTSGKGIDFSATSDATGMTSELLDDYEEGTWTPVVTGSTSAGTGTYTTQRATYTKIGRTVAFTIHIVWSAHTGTGTMRVTLPFAAATTPSGLVYYPFSVVGSTLTAPASTTIAAMGFSTLSYMNIYSVTQTTVNANALAMDTSAGFYINGTYEV